MEGRRGAIPTAVAISLIVIATCAGEAWGRGFDLGVQAGDATSHAITIWTRAGEKGSVTAQIAPAGRLGECRRASSAGPCITRSLRARRQNDLTVQARIRDLRPGTRYEYRFRAARSVSPVGAFTTAPRQSSRAPLSFAYSGDADSQRPRGWSRPYYTNWEVFSQMAREATDFNVNIGDTIFSETDLPGRYPEDAEDYAEEFPLAATRTQKWRKYRNNLHVRNFRRFARSTSTYTVWSDHNWKDGFTRERDGERLYRAGVSAYHDYTPSSIGRRYGIYRNVRWGRNLEIFLLDERSFRSASVSDLGVCDNPLTEHRTLGRSDLAPTLPPQNRAFFGLFSPQFRAPVSARCLEAINDPARTMLGRRQLNRFLRDAKTSKATWKVVMTESPIQQLYIDALDRWEGYAAERGRVLRALSGRVENLVFLTSDVDATIVNDVNFRTLGPAGPRPTGFIESTVGPAAASLYSREADRSGQGTTRLIYELFLKPAPPVGLGVACARLDAYSYSRIDVTSTTFSIRPKGIDGAPLRDQDGRPCGPFVLSAGS